MRVRVPRVRVTIGRLMLVVALTCVTLAAARAHVLIGVFAGATSASTLARTFLATDRLRAQGRTVGVGVSIHLMIGSLGTSVLLLVAATLAGALLMPAPNSDPAPPALASTPGFLVSITVLYWLRRFYWPPSCLRSTDAADPPG